MTGVSAPGYMVGTPVKAGPRFLALRTCCRWDALARASCLADE
ncbi:hypothetical protein [Mycobacteroides abscessus]|nr:hypothetical protein [Mycobacteroides abscessus]